MCICDLVAKNTGPHRRSPLVPNSGDRGAKRRVQHTNYGKSDAVQPSLIEIEAPSVLTTLLLATITFSEIRFLQGSSWILVGAGSLALQFRLRLNSELDLDLYLRLG